MIISIPSILLIGLIHAYRFFSPVKLYLLGPHARCKFHPTCSAYAIDAIKVHGACYGSFLAVKRIIRCNPWSEGGEDPVPEKKR